MEQKTGKSADGALPSLTGRQTAVFHLAMMAAVLLPLVLVIHPALVDYPNHLARLHILANIGRDSALADNYQVVWQAMPNLAMDLAAYPLLGLVSVETLGLVFTALALVLPAAGAIALHKALHGRVGPWPAVAWLFAYNHLLIMGFLNYLIGVGLALLLFAGWIASAGRPGWIRLVVFPVALLGLYYVHLFALGIYGVCVAGYEASRAWPELRADWKRAVASRLAVAWQFLPAAILVLATMPQAAQRSFYYGPLLQKVKALWSPLLAYLKPVDLGLFLFVAAVAIAGFATRRFRLAGHMAAPLVLLLLLAAVMPFKMEGAWGHIWYADLRLPVVLALLLAAAVKPPSISARVLAPVLVIGAVIFGWRILDVAAEWIKVDRDFREFRAALPVVERGAAVLPVQLQNVPLAAGETRFEHAYWHMPVLAAVDRAAFVPTLFTDPAKQPVRAAPARLEMDTEFGAPIELALLLDSAAGGGTVAGGMGMRPFWKDWPGKYDYVVVTHFGKAGNPLPNLLAPVHRGSFFDIYRIAKAEPAGMPENPTK